jgi:hypothetical protein
VELVEMVPEGERHRRNWGGFDLPDEIDVVLVDGRLMAINSRTLYCYKASLVSQTQPRKPSW